MGDDRDAIAASHAPLQQAVGDTVAAKVEFAKRQRLVPERQAARIG
jgi:hypothetical protein